MSTNQTPPNQKNNQASKPIIVGNKPVDGAKTANAASPVKPAVEAEKSPKA